MNSNGEFTNDDLIYYAKASKTAIMYLYNLINMYFGNNGMTAKCMLDDRLKKLKSINEKIAKKKMEMGENFSVDIHLLDIAGLRIIFCDSDEFIKYNGNVKKLDEYISKLNPAQFSDEFNRASMKFDNRDIRHLYGFVGCMTSNASKFDEIINVVIIKDYVQFQKESGYQSIHVIINVQVECTDEKGNVIYDIDGNKQMKTVPVEIQLRNFVQHLYDELEHDVRYKKIQTDVSYDYSRAFDAAKRILNDYSNEYFEQNQTADKYK